MNENSNKIKVKVITHEKVVFERDVDELYVQSTDGRLGILPNHIPVVCALDIGVTKVIVDKEPIHITTMAGVLQFSQNEATILTDIAELGDDIDLTDLNLKTILGSIFSFFALIMGVPFTDCASVGAMMGEKLVLNEFIAYTDLVGLQGIITHKAEVIASFALCGFANFGSVAIQIGGIGELAPSRRKDLATLGIKALICGTFASYISACMAGILLG